MTKTLAAGLFGLAVAEIATAIGCGLAGGISWADAVDSFTVTNGVIGLALSACGALLAWHRPRNPIGWLFLAGGVAYATSTAAVSLLGLGGSAGWSTLVLRLLASLFGLAWPWAIGLCLPLALLLFPDGRPPGRRWRWLIWAIVAEGMLFELSFAAPGPQSFGSRSVVPYLAIPFYHRLGALWAATNIAWAALFLLVLASLVVRYRRGGDVERRQLLWLLLAVLVVLAYAGVPWGIFGRGPVLGLLVIPLIPAAVTVAILRYQLLDIRLVVSRALVYGLLTAAAAGAYVGLVALLDVLVRSRVSLDSAVVASVIVAVGFNPARVRLQRLIDRGLYGDRRDPVRAVSLVGERLAGTGAAGLAGVLEALCDSLRLPFAAVRFGSAEAAAHGTAPELLHSISLSYDGARIGELIVGLRSGQRRLQPAGHRGAGAAGRPAGRRAARHRAVGRAAGVAGQHRGRARGGTPQAPPRPARRARPGADRDRVQSRRGPQRAARRARPGQRAAGRAARGHHRGDHRHPAAGLRPAAAGPR